MRTWIDKLCYGAADIYAQAAALAGVKPHAVPADDGAAMQFLTADAVERAGSDRRLTETGGMEGLLITIAPFFHGPASGTPQPSAFAAGPDLAATFADCRLSDEIQRLGKAEALRRMLTYIDIEHRALMIGDHVQVRALFLERVPSARCTDASRAPGGDDAVRFTAILTRPGENTCRVVSWFDGGRTPLSDDCDAGVHAFFGLWLPALAETLEAAGVELEDVLGDAERFAWLTLAFASTAGDEALAPPLPWIPAGHPRRRGRRSRQVAKKFSLFVVRPLRAPRDRFGRARAKSGAGWKLGHRVRVQGHFRLQPYGKGRKKRRLVWIAEHERGPHGAVPRTPLIALRQPPAEASRPAEAAANDNAPAENDRGDREWKEVS